MDKDFTKLPKSWHDNVVMLRYAAAEWNHKKAAPSHKRQEAKDRHASSGWSTSMDDIFADVVLLLIECLPTREVFNVCQFESTCFMQCPWRCVVFELPRSRTGENRARCNPCSDTELRRSLGRGHCLRRRQYCQRKRRELQS
jgi:hypothetical protein